MTIKEAEQITTEFGEFYANRGSLVVLTDGTIADDYEDIPYFSVWDLPHSPAMIKQAILYRAEHAVKHGYMDFITPGDEKEKTATMNDLPIGNWLMEGYGLLGDFIEQAYEINKKRQEIWQIEDTRLQKVAEIKFEAKNKIRLTIPDHHELRIEFQNYLADLHGNWRRGNNDD